MVRCSGGVPHCNDCSACLKVAAIQLEACSLKEVCCNECKALNGFRKATRNLEIIYRIIALKLSCFGARVRRLLLKARPSHMTPHVKRHQPGASRNAYSSPAAAPKKQGKAPFNVDPDLTLLSLSQVQQPTTTRSLSLRKSNISLPTFTKYQSRPQRPSRLTSIPRASRASRVPQPRLVQAWAPCVLSYTSHLHTARHVATTLQDCLCGQHSLR